MSIDTGKTAYRAYSKGAQYGKFGSGDHKSEGGKVVKGVTGKIHIQGGVETDIMKAHGPEGEHILAQRNGYASPDDAPKNKKTGYGQYGFWDDVKGVVLGSGPGQAATSDVGTTGGTGEGGFFTDAMQRKYELEHGFGSWTPEMSEKFGNIAGFNQDRMWENMSSEDKQKWQLQEMMFSGMENIVGGTETMKGFLQENLQEQLGGYERQKDRLDTTTQDIQYSLMDQYQGASNVQTKTGLVGSDPTSRKRIERAGTSQMKEVGLGLQDIWSGERQAETQYEKDIFETDRAAEDAMASMMTNYMTATGEELPEGYMSFYEEYLQGNENEGV